MPHRDIRYHLGSHPVNQRLIRRTAQLEPYGACQSMSLSSQRQVATEMDLVFHNDRLYLSSVAGSLPSCYLSHQDPAIPR